MSRNISFVALYKEYCDAKHFIRSIAQRILFREMSHLWHNDIMPRNISSVALYKGYCVAKYLICAQTILYRRLFHPLALHEQYYNTKYLICGITILFRIFRLWRCTKDIVSRNISFVALHNDIVSRNISFIA